MSLSYRFSQKRPSAADYRVAFVFDETKPSKLDADLLASAGFEGSLGETAVTRDKEGPVLAVGLGSLESYDRTSLRQAAIAAGRLVGADKATAVTLPVAVGEVTPAISVETIAEGLRLGSYRYEVYRSGKKKPALSMVTILDSGSAALRRAAVRGTAIADAVCLARDLVNEPGGDLTPDRFAKIATKIAKAGKMKIKVLGLAEIKKAKMGGILGVARGSDQPPRFVEMTYTPKAKKHRGHLALIGKGITFDSGGLSIKTGAGMMTMKCDMGGAAAVLGAMSALPAIAPNTKVTALIPLSDNMLGGDATRPGDVLKIRNGKTVEVLNTDAEGRLVLADALSIATERKPDAAVDLATLTGACVVALGEQISGLMSNHDQWRDQIEGASEKTGERVWRLPLPDDYRKLIESPVADIKNIGGRWGGALTAGLFLKEFVGEDLPWAHLDIAGPAFHETVSTDHPVGGSGVGVRLLIELAETFRKPNG